MAETSLIIGIDTGGTYTDAVVIDAVGHRILASAKAITTKGDLAIGVGDALRMAIAGVAQFNSAAVSMVSVSTTLATNAIVEGHGGNVALALIGFDVAMEQRSGLAEAFGAMPIQRFAGGHDHAGREVAALDETYLRRWAAEVAQEVTGFAVVSCFATRNGAHELRAADIIAAETRRPVTLSHQLADALDAPRRAQTAVLNARLVWRISGLVEAVRSVMAELKISCSLMLMKGDGSLASADAVAQRPIETVLSGPAASLVGAQWLSGLDDFIMADMGGTTTDVGLLMAGMPRIASEGAEVGAWRTMVKAIDLKTIGLGGDSEVHLETGKGVRLGPQRVVPISLLARRQPEVIALLQADLATKSGGSLLGKFVVLPFGSRSSPKPVGLPVKEAEVLARLSEIPMPLRFVATGSAGLRAVASLRKKGLIQLCAFSPSDAAHVLKLQNNWRIEASVLAAQIAFRFNKMKLPDEAQLLGFCQSVWDVAVQGSTRIILDSAFGENLDGPLVDAVARGQVQVGQVKVQLTPIIPIVAVGGPVKVYYGEVARRLGCDVVFAPHHDVANAVGAACALVACTVSLRIDGDGNGGFLLTGHGTPETFGSAADAIAAAEKRASTLALAMAEAQGGKSPKLHHRWIKHHMPGFSDDAGLLTAELHTHARGRPV
jgi:N-methylhydantoinase A/oxoprolinase/acetone carboxylase beta subunit